MDLPTPSARKRILTAEPMADVVTGILIGLGRDDGQQRSERQRGDGRQQQGAGRHGSHR